MSAAVQFCPTEMVETPLMDMGLAGFRVIVLDDDRIDQERIGRALRLVGLGDGICRANTLLEFAEKIENDNYDFAFIDFNLTDGTGLDAIQLLARQKRPKPALPIMISGDVRAEVAIQAVKDGCKDYVCKSNLSADTLRDAMRQALKKSGLSNDDDVAEDRKTQIIMKVVNDAATTDLRPRFSRMLRLIRQLRNTDDAMAKQVQIQQLEQDCLELQTYCERFSQEMVLRSESLH